MNADTSVFDYGLWIAGQLQIKSARIPWDQPWQVINHDHGNQSYLFGILWGLTEDGKKARRGLGGIEVYCKIIFSTIRVPLLIVSEPLIVVQDRQFVNVESHPP
jgi:hypothetical protein